MITLNKWYPLVHPTPHDAKSVACEKACKHVEMEYKAALECHKQVKATQELEVELYNKRAQQNTIELTNMHTNVTNIRRFAIFV